MADGDRREKDEKEEKRREKDEKSRGEKWANDPVGAITWALVLVWLGLALLAQQTGYAEDHNLNTWGIFFLGWGGIMIVMGFVRGLVPGNRWWTPGNLVLGFILLAVGFGMLYTWELVWPFALFAIAAIILLSAFARRRR